MFLGIDFGTSWSQISTMNYGKPLLLLNPGEYGIPSAFYYASENGILIGQNALDAGQGKAASNLITNVKMELLSGKKFTLDGRSFSAQEIIAEIYKALIKKAIQMAKKHFIDPNIEGVVISVPAQFCLQERNLIRDAAKSCLGEGNDLRIIAIVKEPVAAAMSYYTSTSSSKYVLVYDLGGGTCDVAIVQSNSSIYEPFTVIDSDMVRVGGRNWDEELCEYITEILEDQSGISIRGNAGYEEKIRRTAITVKHELSDSTKESVFARVELNGEIYKTIITRKIFDEITHSLLQQTVDCLKDIYCKHSSDYSIDEIICVGGSSNMLQVEEALTAEFPQCTIRLFEPEHAVVNGAAIRAEKGVVDIANYSYGTDTYDDYDKDPNYLVVSNIIKKGAKLPAQHSKNYTPTKDNQTAVAFSIYESEYASEQYDYSGSEKRLVGTVRLLLPPGAKKTLSITCTLRLNSDGLLEVEASEPSGRIIKSEFKIENL